MVVVNTGRFVVSELKSGGPLHGNEQGVQMRKESNVFSSAIRVLFRRREAKAHSLVYLQGLILGEGRKNVERIALRFSTARDSSPPSQNEVVALQEFLTLSPWQACSVQGKIQDVFAEELVPSTSAWCWAQSAWWMNRRSSRADRKVAAWRDNGAVGWARKKTVKSASI